jgi:hypothetical protein
MFDWGLYQLRKECKEKKGLPIPPSVFINYNWDLNRIRIDGLDIESLPENEKEAKGLCKFYINTMKHTCGKDTIWTFFYHEGFERKSKPENLRAELNNIIVLSVGVRLKPDNPDGLVGVSCESSLLETKIMYSDTLFSYPNGRKGEEK